MIFYQFPPEPAQKKQMEEITDVPIERHVVVVARELRVHAELLRLLHQHVAVRPARQQIKDQVLGSLKIKDHKPHFMSPASLELVYSATMPHFLSGAGRKKRDVFQAG